MPAEEPVQAGAESSGGKSTASADKAGAPELPELPAPDDAEPGRLQGDADERREAHERRSRLERIRAALERAEEDPGNLQAFFDKLDDICAGRDDCDALFDEALEDVDPERAAMMRRIRERLPAYEEQMKRTRMSVTETPPRERYERIQQMRNEMLGAEEAEALYGQERAFAEFRLGLGDLLDRAESMSGQQRRQELAQLRDRSFGEYEQQLTEEEGDLGRYRHELQLMLEGVDSEQSRQRITREVRERNLDAEMVERMERRDAEREEQQAEVSDYQQAEQELEDEMEAKRGQMPQEQWEQEYRQRMTELRREHFD